MNQSTQKNSNRRRRMTIATLIFLLIGAAFLLMYLLVWRYEEDTDDAYVAGRLAYVTAQIPGTVASVNVEDTQHVREGDVLVTLDDADASLALERAKSTLTDAVRRYEAVNADADRAQAQVQAARIRLNQAENSLRRRLKLAGTDAVSPEEIDTAKAEAAAAKAALTAAQAQQRAAESQTGNTPLREQPAILTAEAALKSAWLNLQRTKIRAPQSGQIAKRNVEAGQTVAAGMPLMAVADATQVWVDANFKESQLSRMKIGQPVKLTSDLYGKNVVFHGQVAGFSAGTGSAFSVLPAQNATGNWIKVVQRVPVRIRLNPQELEKHPLRIGLSMRVEVDTAHEGNPSAAMPEIKSKDTETDWQGAQDIIDNIINHRTR